MKTELFNGGIKNNISVNQFSEGISIFTWTVSNLAG